MMRYLAFLSLLFAIPAFAVERQIPFYCEPIGSLGWGKAWAGEVIVENGVTTIDRTVELEVRNDCFANNADVGTSGEAVLLPDAPPGSEFASWNQRYEGGGAFVGQLHVRHWFNPQTPGQHRSYTENRLSLDVVAGRHYRIEPVLRPKNASNTNYVAVVCWGSGFSQSWYQSSLFPELWPPRWDATRTERCTVTVATTCQKYVAPGETPTEKLCHNDAIAYERDPRNPYACGIGPELALVMIPLVAVSRMGVPGAGGT